jgi:quinol monooxygenase YgiN
MFASYAQNERSLMFAVVVTLNIDPVQWDAFLPLMHKNADASMTEEGCAYFDTCTDPERPNEVFLYELYDHPAAFAAHLKTPHFLAFDAAVKDMVIGRDVRTFKDVRK